MGGDLSNEVKMNDDSLYHHGILGMKWGVRRTPAQLGHKKKSSKNMSDDELREAIARKKLENEYNSYYQTTTKKRSTATKFLAAAGTMLVIDIIKPSVCNIGKQYVNSILANGINTAKGWGENSPYKIYTNNRKKD